MKLKSISLACASAGLLALVGCGGGAGTTETSVTVTPSLGRFSDGVKVRLHKPDNTDLVTGSLLNGKYTGKFSGYSGPVVVEVQGDATATYYDEGTKTTKPFGVGKKLRAIMPAPQAEVGVSALTNAAVIKIEAAGTLASVTPTNINDANAKIAAATGLGTASILQAPTLVDANSVAKTLNVAIAADKYALLLAALAKTATGTNTAVDMADALALDLKDDTFDGKEGTAAIANAPTPTALTTQFTAAATEFATVESETVIAAAPLAPVATVTNVSGDTTAPVNLAKAMFAELRATLNSFGNSAGTGFLNTQATRANADLTATVAPAVDKVAYRLGALSTAADVYQAAKAYTVDNPGGLTTGTDPSGLTSNSVLIYQAGDLFATWQGWGTFEKCWTDSVTPINVNSVTCSSFGSSSADPINSRFKFVVFTLTPTGTANQYTYTATRYNRKVTLTNGWLAPINSAFPWNGSATLASNSLLTTASTTVVLPVGNGTFTKLANDQLTLNGTLPPSTNVCVAPNVDSAKQQSLECPQGQIQIPATGVDTVVISATRAALPTASNYRYAVTGSISTVSALDATKVSSIAMESGTYVDKDETNANTTGSLIVGAKVIGSVQTAATKFTGTIDMGSFVIDASGTVRSPTSMSFTGVISDLTTGGAGAFLTGQLSATVTGYGSFNANVPESANNYLHTGVTFTGTVQAPSRPELKLVLAGSRPTWDTNSVTLTYSYGTTVKITGTATSSAGTSGSLLTLTNQDGIDITLDNAAGTGTVKKAGTNLATIANGLINYTDGVTESLN